MIVLDLEKAFDTVWHHGLIFKLSKFNLPNYLIKIIQNYLKDRKFIVTTNREKSKTQVISAGVPQGPILGPALFLYYINDLQKMTGVKLSLFADETAA